VDEAAIVTDQPGLIVAFRNALDEALAVGWTVGPGHGANLAQDRAGGKPWCAALPASDFVAKPSQKAKKRSTI
jgi:hypothetical protein